MLKELLLLSGDIEANPGPDLAKIAKKLSEIALDIEDIKEKRLTDIEAKLDTLSSLESRIACYQDQLDSMTQTIHDLQRKVDDLNIVAECPIYCL